MWMNNSSGTCDQWLVIAQKHAMKILENTPCATKEQRCSACCSLLTTWYDSVNFFIFCTFQVLTWVVSGFMCPSVRTVVKQSPMMIIVRFPRSVQQIVESCNLRKIFADGVMSMASLLFVIPHAIEDLFMWVLILWSQSSLQNPRVDTLVVFCVISAGVLYGRSSSSSSSIALGLLRLVPPPPPKWWFAESLVIWGTYHQNIPLQSCIVNAIVVISAWKVQNDS